MVISLILTCTSQYLILKQVCVCIYCLSLSCHQETALHNAARQDYIKIVKYLVGKQPDININIPNEYQVSVVILPGIVF